MKSALYFLTEEDGRCRQIVNGVVTSLNKKTPIPAPINTRDILIIWERDLNKWATIRNFSLSLPFVLDGYNILKNDYYKFNIDRKLFLLIKRLICEVDAINYKIYYKHLYKGELDFSTFNDNKGDVNAEVNISETGLQKLIKANENTKFFIPFDDDAINVRMDGITLTIKQNFIIPQVTSVEVLGDFVHIIGASKTNTEGNAAGFASFDVYFDKNQPTDFTTDTRYSFITLQAITGIRIKGQIKVTDPVDDGDNYTAEIKTSLGNNVVLVPSTPLATGLNTFDFDVTFNGAADERFFFIGTYGSGATAAISYIETSFFITLSSKKAETIIKAFKPYDLFVKICDKLGITSDKIISTILQSCTFCLTSGNGIRDIEDSGVTTSFNDFIKAFNVYLCTGVQIRSNIILESRYDFFVLDSVDPAIELGTIRDFKVTPAMDLIYSSIKFGHAEQNSIDVNDVNGKFGFNGFHVYTTPVKRSESKELDLQSNYKADPFEEELLRINLDGKETSGNNADNDVYVVDVNISGGEVDGAFNLDRSQVPTDGVPDTASIFNVRLRPSELLKAHYKWIRSWLFGYDADIIKFERSNRNGGLIVNGETDGRNIAINSMGDRIFISDYGEFQVNVPIEIQETLDSSPNKCFAFDSEGIRYTGYLWKAGLAPNSRADQAYKVLFTIENDRLTLI